MSGVNVFRWNEKFIVFRPKDRSIEVQPGDSLSIYSMAIYGDFHHIDKFTLENRQPIVNKDLIYQGTKVYHYDPLPNETYGVGETGPSIPGNPHLGKGPINLNGVLNHENLERLLRFVVLSAIPLGQWKVTSSSGADASGIIFTGQYMRLGLTPVRPPGPEVLFHMIGGGVAFGPESAGGSFTFALPSFPSTGAIYKSPMAGPELSQDEISGPCLVIEIAGSLLAGVSFSAVFFGLDGHANLMDIMAKFLTGPTVTSMPMTPMGFITLMGLNVGGSTNLFTCGVAFRVGYMRPLPW